MSDREPRDERLHELVAEHTSLRPATPEERVAFQSELDRRLEAPRRGLAWVPALGALAVAGALTVLVFLPASSPTPLGSELDLESALGVSQDQGWSEELDLPVEYLAIEELLLDG